MPISREQLIRNTIERELETVNYIRENWYEHDRLAVVLLNRDKPARQIIHTAGEICEPGFQARLRAENANKSNIYISMNALKPDARGRTKADIAEIRHVFLDIDSNAPAVIEKIRADERIPVPHHILESSPGKAQVIWSVSGFDLASSENLIRGMAHEHGADIAVVDASRVLRLPGFANRKYDAPHYIHDLQTVTTTKAEYKPTDFPEFSQQRSRVITMPSRSVQASGGQSKSEEDWREVMRQLEKGVAPSLVRDWLQGHRPDKPNPQYYAERTVDRAVKKNLEQKQGFGISR